MDANALKALLAPVVVGVCEALKSAGVPTKLLPIIAIALGGVGGLGIGLAYGGTGPALVGDVLTGLGAGAIGTGGYAVITGIGGGGGAT